VSASPPDARAGWLYLGLALLVVALWFASLAARPLFNPDEGRYAEIPREMLAGGDWVVPHLSGLAYIEKPPLQYWATALCLRVFGQNEFAARVYTAWCALGTLAAVWWIAEALWGWAAAWRASAVLSGMLLFAVLGQLLTLDMSLTFYMTLALAGFLRAQTPTAEQAVAPLQAPTHAPAWGAQRRWMLVAWGATALGLLTKGLVAGAIPAAVLLLYSLYTRDWSPWRRLSIAWGLPLLLAMAVPWHWLAARRQPDFLQFFFVHEHLSRYLTPSADREEPGWFFGVVLVLGSLPWTVSALRVVGMGWRQGARGQFQPRPFLWLWVVFVCVFFSLSDSKLIPYILPALPALALLIGALPTHALRRDVLSAAVLTLVMALILAVSGIWAPRFMAATGRNAYFLMLAQPLAQIAALLAVSGLFVLSQRRRDLTRATVFLGVGWCLAGILLMRAAAVVAPVYSGVGLAGALKVVPRDARIFSVGTYDQTLPFYSQRTLELVAYRGELDFGLRQAPSAELRSVAEFIDQWQNIPYGYAVMEIAMFDELRRRGVPLREMSRDVHRVVAARR
jgi:4-amino-4-deoxy-L-arabinose transferase-like glycosyltransferase